MSDREPSPGPASTPDRPWLCIAEPWSFLFGPHPGVDEAARRQAAAALSPVPDALDRLRLIFDGEDQGEDSRDDPGGRPA